MLLAAFAAIERRTPRPLVPPGIFGDRSFSAANAVAVLVTTAMLPTFFIRTLYLQQVLDLPPLEAGPAFLPISLSLMVSTLNGPRLAVRFGTRLTLMVAMGMAAAGLAWFGFLSLDGSVLTHVLGPSVLTGAGAGVAWTASARAAPAGAGPQDVGLRSGVLIASQRVGGAVGLGVVGAVAVAIAGPAADREALTAGLAAGLRVAAGVATFGAAMVAVAVPNERNPAGSDNPARGRQPRQAVQARAR